MGKAIEEFEGGVIIISHNKEFCSAVATEKWIMKAGILKQEGESVEKAAKETTGDGNKGEEEGDQGSGEEAQGWEEEEDSDGGRNLGDGGQVGGPEQRAGRE